MKYLVLSILILLLIHCRDPDFHVRATKLANHPQKKIMVGSIQNRDYRTPKSIAKDFRELFVFELMQKGYLLSHLNPKLLEREVDLYNDKSSLPVNLRKSAGEASINLNQLERHLEKQEIKNMIQSESADLFLQGVVSIQSNEKILDRKDYNYIFLNVYDMEGNLVGMVNSSFDEKILGESEMMRKVATSLAAAFDKNIK